jgi:hypothetical protein
MTERVRTVGWSLPSDSYGQRFLDASILASGDLLIEGQDLGRDLPVGGMAGVTEYEYSWSIASTELARLVEVLGGAPGDDVLRLLVAHFVNRPSAELGPFFEAHAIPASFWSHFSD